VCTLAANPHGATEPVPGDNRQRHPKSNRHQGNEQAHGQLAPQQGGDWMSASAGLQRFQQTWRATIV